MYKEQIAQEKRVEREAAKVVKEKEKAEKATNAAEKLRQRDAAKALQLSQKGKRKASRPPKQTIKRKKQVVDTLDNEEYSGGASAALPVTTRRGRNVTLPSRYK